MPFGAEFLYSYFMASWTEGLNSDLIFKQKEKFGENKLAKRNRVRVFKILFSQLTSPLVYVLLAASLVTYFLGEYIDCVMILVAVFINAILGFVQEYKAERSLLALASILTPRIDVFRDGKKQKISVEDLVVGDVVFLSDEHRVPADGVIFSEDGLFVDESILTGESVAVEKYDSLLIKGWEKLERDVVIEQGRRDFDKAEEKFKVFMGSRVEVGVGKMLVLRVGKETQIGQIAQALKKEKEQETPLQKQVRRLSKQLAFLVAIVSVVVMIVGLSAGDSFSQIFPITVALAVAAIPEGLVISMTVVLAIGMQRILKQNAVVRSLTAAETLGSVDVICADKTGTLTEGIMKVTKVVVSLGNPSKKQEDNILRAAILCNDHRDPLEHAIDEWVKEQSVDVEKLSKEYPRVDSIPFAHKNRYIATLHQGDGMYVAGAPEIILQRSKLRTSDVEMWLKKLSELASLGYRLVGFAKKETDISKLRDEDVSQLEWLGLLVYEDPVRVGVAQMMKEVMEIGVDVKVITGDYKETAVAIMRQIGILGGDLESKVLTGDELDALDDINLMEKIDNLVLFARVKPQQKLRIVEALKKKGHMVAMTGDGVNDALALKQADVGVVVNEASDVAKETADLVLLKSEFGTIVRAVEEGRGIFDNLKKIIVYLLSDAFAGIILVIGSLVLRWPLPLLATQILWINLISDGFPSMALTVEPYDIAVLKAKINRNKKLLDGQAVWLIGLISCAAAVVTLFIFWLSYFVFGETIEKARTMAFAMLGTASLVYVFSSRSLTEPILKVYLFRNKWLIGGVILGGLLQIAAVYLPVLQKAFETTALSFSDWIWILGLCQILVLVIEGVKFVTSKKLFIRPALRS